MPRSRALVAPSTAVALLLAACGGDTKTVTVETPPTTTTEPPPAQIVDVGRGIAGVAVGMSSAKVKQVLGEPDNETEIPGVLGGTNTKLDYPGTLTIRLSTAGDNVIAIESSSPDAHTREGFGVGDREEEIVRGVGSVSCQGEQGVRSCSVGDPSAGGIVTDFRIVGGRVQQVIVARVID